MSKDKHFEVLAPTWEAACRIYLMALSSDRTPEDVKHDAREDILNLARAYDKVVADRAADEAKGETRQ